MMKMSSILVLALSPLMLASAQVRGAKPPPHVWPPVSEADQALIFSKAVMAVRDRGAAPTKLAHGYDPSAPMVYAANMMYRSGVSESVLAQIVQMSGLAVALNADRAGCVTVHELQRRFGAPPPVNPCRLPENGTVISLLKIETGPDSTAAYLRLLTQRPGDFALSVGIRVLFSPARGDPWRILRIEEFLES